MSLVMSLRSFDIRRADWAGLEVWCGLLKSTATVAPTPAMEFVSELGAGQEVDAVGYDRVQITGQSVEEASGLLRFHADVVPFAPITPAVVGDGAAGVFFYVPVTDDDDSWLVCSGYAFGMSEFGGVDDYTVMVPSSGLWVRGNP